MRDGHVKIIPERFEKIYFQWIDNLRDWCISRQIWWGHRIPVWYDQNDKIHLPDEKELIFARHGQSEANAANIFQGIHDTPLTELGRTQASELAESLRGKKISKVICSDLKRAHETAQIVAKELEISDIEVTAELREMDFGELNGKTKQEVFGTDDTYIEHELPLIFDDKIGDNFEETIAKRKAFLERVKKENREDVLIVSHETTLATVFGTHKLGENLNRETFVTFAKTFHMKNAQPASIPFFVAPEGENLRQDTDTLDTWFSSALWPFSTLGWPNEEAPDLQKFYPTDVLETGHDILFFWVARMLMFGKYATGKFPFHTTYLHGLVTDEYGKKMSKSKGNGVDPIEIIEQYGADPVRLALVIGSAPGQNIPIGEAKISGYRNFVNKLWNAGRFVEMQMKDCKFDKLNKPEEYCNIESLMGTPQSVAENWIYNRFQKVTKSVKNDLEKYNISSAGDTIYHFVWGEFCDWFIEASKVQPNPDFLAWLYFEILKLMHPLCPFVTEEIYQNFFGKDVTLMDYTFPELSLFKEENGGREAFPEFFKSVDDFEKIRKLVTEVRSLRADEKINPKEKLVAQLVGDLDGEVLNLIEVLAGIKFDTVEGENVAKIVVEDLEVLIQIPVDEARVAAEIAKLKQEISALEGRLSNKKYVDNAPEKLVADTRDNLEKAKEKLGKMEE